MNTQPSNYELYQVFVETITAAENRRQQVSNSYYVILGVCMGFLSLDVKIDHIYVAVGIAILSLIVFGKIHHFRVLADAKFAVIKELEKSWEIRPFEIEWKQVEEKKHLPFEGVLTTLERTTPILVCVGCILYILWRLLF